jgi:hypothetical protein
MEELQHQLERGGATAPEALSRAVEAVRRRMPPLGPSALPLAPAQITHFEALLRAHHTTNGQTREAGLARMWLENDDAARVEHAATLEAASRRGGTHSTAGDAWDGCIVELLRARVSAAIFQLGHGGECADTLSPVEPLSSVVLPALTLVRGGALHAVRGECAVTRTHRFMADGLFLEPGQAQAFEQQLRSAADEGSTSASPPTTEASADAVAHEYAVVLLRTAHVLRTLNGAAPADAPRLAAADLVERLQPQAASWCLLAAPHEPTATGRVGALACVPCAVKDAQLLAVLLCAPLAADCVARDGAALAVSKRLAALRADDAREVHGFVATPSAAELSGSASPSHSSVTGTEAMDEEAEVVGGEEEAGEAEEAKEAGEAGEAEEAGEAQEAGEAFEAAAVVEGADSALTSGVGGGAFRSRKRDGNGNRLLWFARAHAGGLPVAAEAEAEAARAAAAERAAAEQRVAEAGAARAAAAERAAAEQRAAVAAATRAESDAAAQSIAQRQPLGMANGGNACCARRTAHVS